MAEPRYCVSERVEHACCHEASVEDTYTSQATGEFTAICECQHAEQAKRIADALNATERPQ